MRVVTQRVFSASVSVAGRPLGSIDRGLLIFLGVGRGDAQADADWLVGRLGKLRIFESKPGRMDDSIQEVGGGALVISQFTLFGSLKKGNRPSFNRAAAPEEAEALYEYFVNALGAQINGPVASGAFGEDMRIEAINDGPVTLILDSKERDF